MNIKNQEDWENYNPIFTFGEHDIEDDAEVKREEN